MTDTNTTNDRPSGEGEQRDHHEEAIAYCPDCGAEKPPVSIYIESLTCRKCGTTVWFSPQGAELKSSPYITLASLREAIEHGHWEVGDGSLV